MLRGEVWWVNFDPSIGTEIQKIRPAIIISNNFANNNLQRVVVIPITSNIKNIYSSEALVTVNKKQGKALSDQITTVDKKRLTNQLGIITEKDLKNVEKALKIHLGLKL